LFELVSVDCAEKYFENLTSGLVQLDSKKLLLLSFFFFLSFVLFLFLILFFHLAVWIEQNFLRIAPRQLILGFSFKRFGDYSRDVIECGKCIQIIGIFLHQSFHQRFGQREWDVGLFEYQNGEAHELQHAHP
jgi:hypothetical protein